MNPGDIMFINGKNGAKSTVTSSNSAKEKVWIAVT